MVEMALYWPEPMVRHLERYATRLGRSMSWCAQTAWTMSRNDITSLEPGADHPRAWANQVALYGEAAAGTLQRFHVPDEMSRELQAEAARQDRSMSWLLQRAWSLAVDQIGSMEPAKEE